LSDDKRTKDILKIVVLLTVNIIFINLVYHCLFKHFKQKIKVSDLSRHNSTACGLPILNNRAMKIILEKPVRMQINYHPGFKHYFRREQARQLSFLRMSLAECYRIR